MRLIDADELKKNIEYETGFAKGETWDWKEILTAIDEQPTVGLVITDKEMAEYIHSDPEKATKLNEEIRKWGARREIQS